MWIGVHVTLTVGFGIGLGLVAGTQAAGPFLVYVGAHRPRAAAIYRVSVTSYLFGAFLLFTVVQITRHKGMPDGAAVGRPGAAGHAGTWPRQRPGDDLRPRRRGRREDHLMGR